MIRNQHLFYAKPYPGRFTDYVRAQSLNPTPNLVVTSAVIQRPRSSGYSNTFRTVRQGCRSVNRHHDYTYGTSRKSLRPVVTDDEAWLMSIDLNYRPR